MQRIARHSYPVILASPIHGTFPHLLNSGPNKGKRLIHILPNQISGNVLLN